MLQADPSKVSQRAKKRGLPQVCHLHQFYIRLQGLQPSEVGPTLAVHLLCVPSACHLLTLLHLFLEGFLTWVLLPTLASSAYKVHYKQVSPVTPK